MTGLVEIQSAFARAVLDAEAPVPARLARKAGGVPARRFSVYRNNVYSSLIDVLAGRFSGGSPACRRGILPRHGPPLCRTRTPRVRGSHPLRREFPPAASVPYLADMAALEWAWHSAYHAANSVPLPLHALAAATDRAADAVLALHPSLSIVRSLYPTVSIYEMNVKAGDVPPTQVSGKEDALVARPRLQMEIRHLPEGGAPFIFALKNGSLIGEAAAVASHEAPEFDLETNLAGLIASGAIVGLRASAGG